MAIDIGRRQFIRRVIDWSATARQRAAYGPRRKIFAAALTLIAAAAIIAGSGVAKSDDPNSNPACSGPRAADGGCGPQVQQTQPPSTVCQGSNGFAGPCQCDAGYAAQQGFVCCPFGTMAVHGNSQCLSICPNGATDPNSVERCEQGYNPVPEKNGTYYCLNGVVPAPGGSCAALSPLLNAAVCPDGWTKTVNPSGTIPYASCKPTSQEQACQQKGMDVGLDGTCQTICPSGSWPFPIYQCCPIGATLLPNGSCPGLPPPPSSKVCPAGEVEVDGNCVRAPKVQERKATPQTPTTPGGPQVQQVQPTCLQGEVFGPNGCACPDGEVLGANGCACPANEVLGASGCACPAGEIFLPPPAGGVGLCVSLPTSTPSCPPTQLTSTGQCCPNDQTPQPDGSCGAPPPPPSNSCQQSGNTLYCAPNTDGSCPLGSTYSGTACVATGPSCGSSPAMCCPSGQPPNFTTVQCCAPDTIPQGTSCVPPPPPTNCGSGEELRDGRCQCLPGYVPDPKKSGCIPGLVTTPPSPAPPPGPAPLPPAPPTGCYAGYALDANGITCVRVTTPPAPPPPAGTTPGPPLLSAPPPSLGSGTTPGTPLKPIICTDGEVFVNGSCQCPRGEVFANGLCECPLPGYELIDGQCQCPPGKHPIFGGCVLNPPAAPPPPTPGTPLKPTCTGGEVMGPRGCEKPSGCPTGEVRTDRGCEKEVTTTPKTPGTTPQEPKKNVPPPPKINVMPPKLKILPPPPKPLTPELKLPSGPEEKQTR